MNKENQKNIHTKYKLDKEATEKNFIMIYQLVKI